MMESDIRRETISDRSCGCGGWEKLRGTRLAVDVTNEKIMMLISIYTSPIPFRVPGMS